MTAEQEKRKFKLWEYKVNHALMLIRSPRPKLGMTNLDIIFYGVEYVEIVQLLGNGLRFVEPTESETAKVKERLGSRLRPGWAKLFALKSGNQRYLVAASEVQVVENQLDIDESVLDLAFQGKTSELGTIIYHDLPPNK